MPSPFLRKSRYVAAVAALTLGVAGLLMSCGPSHPDGAGSSESIPPTTSPTYHVANSATNVQAGVLAGYGIRSLGGNTYRVFWTGDGNSAGGGYHEFWGSMWTTGTFTNQLVGCAGGFCAIEPGDFVSTPYKVSTGERIDWDTFASDGNDGFEVETSSEIVYFDLFIDGKRIPSLVFFPDATKNGSIANPSAIPFGMTTQ
jgi:hypothetical protein